MLTRLRGVGVCVLFMLVSCHLSHQLGLPLQTSMLIAPSQMHSQ